MKPHDSVSVAAAARALKIHRATVHRYLVQNPEIRNKRGKVVINRLKEAIESAKASEPRGRRCSMSPLQIKRSRAKRLSDGTLTPAAMRGAFEGWAKELGDGWWSWSVEDFPDILEEFEPMVKFREQLLARYKELKGNAAARALKIHRTTVHRYWVRNPEICNKRGKVVPIKEKSRRGWIPTPAAMRFVFASWAKEMGDGWMSWSAEDFPDVLEEFESMMKFREQLLARYKELKGNGDVEKTLKS